MRLPPKCPPALGDHIPRDRFKSIDRVRGRLVSEHRAGISDAPNKVLSAL